MRYRITAICNSVKCKGLEIVTFKNKVKKVNTSGQEYTIQNVVCPRCRMWAEISRIDKMNEPCLRQLESVNVQDNK